MENGFGKRSPPKLFPVWHSLVRNKEQLPNLDTDTELLKWWQLNGNTWREQLRYLMIKYPCPNVTNLRQSQGLIGECSTMGGG